MRTCRVSSVVAYVVCASIVGSVVAQPEHANGPDRRAARAGEVAQNPAQPPGGPIAPTDRIRLHKDTITLPFVIDKPGSYVLTSDLTGAPGADGLIVTASEVTIDLNGFTLRGVEGSGAGIVVPDGAGVLRVAIFNGVVTGWGDWGIRLSRADGDTLLEGVEASRNGNGISCPPSSIVRRCQALENADRGILVSFSSLVEDCTAFGNGGIGLTVADQCVANNCTTSFNGGDGLAAFTSIVQSCVSWRNGGNGFKLSDYCTMRDCFATQNQGNGVQSGLGSSILSSRIKSNSQRGVSGGARMRIESCQIISNGQGGVRALDRSTIRDCEFGENFASDAGSGSQIDVTTRCTLEGNSMNRFPIRVDGAPILLGVSQGAGGVFHANQISAHLVQTGAQRVTSNTLLDGAILEASGPGFAPIVDSIADAGPHDNIRLSN